MTTRDKVVDQIPMIGIIFCASVFLQLGIGKPFADSVGIAALAVGIYYELLWVFGFLDDDE